MPDLSSVSTSVRVDHELAGRLRREVGARLAEQRTAFQTAGTPLSGEDERALARDLIFDAVRGYGAQQLAGSVVVPAPVLDGLGRAVWSAMYEADRLQTILDDPDVENVNIVGAEKTFIKYADGRKERGPDIAASDEELVELVRRLAAWVGLSSRPWDVTNPFLRLRLPDGSRLAAIGWVCERPTVSIRRNRYPRITLADMVELGTCTGQVAEFLRAAIGARLTTFIAGDQSVGKSTLLRAMASHIAPHERIFTIEESLELDLAALGKHDDVVALEARKSYGEQAGEVTLTDLVRETLIQDADRVIVGECRGPEIIALINATLGGSGGSLSTVHCKYAKAVFNRIASFAVQSTEAGLTSEVAHMLIAEALELCVFLKIVRDPVTGARRRVVHEIVQVDGFDGATVLSSTLFRYNPATGQAEPTDTIHRFADELADAGYDLGRHAGTNGWRL